MKINRNNSVKKRVIIASVAIIILGSVVCAGFYFNSKNNLETNPSTPSRSDSDIEQAKNLENNPENKTSSPNTDTPYQPPTKDTSTDKQSVSITSSYDISRNTLFIRGGLNGYINEGTCYVLLRGPNNGVIRRETTLLLNASTADCKTISIPISDLSPGRWSFTLHFESKQVIGESDEQSFTL